LLSFDYQGVIWLKSVKVHPPLSTLLFFFRDSDYPRSNLLYGVLNKESILNLYRDRLFIVAKLYYIIAISSIVVSVNVCQIFSSTGSYSSNSCLYLMETNKKPRLHAVGVKSFLECLWAPEPPIFTFTVAKIRIRFETTKKIVIFLIRK